MYKTVKINTIWSALHAKIKGVSSNVFSTLLTYYNKQLYLHKTGDTYEVPKWHYFSLQRTHGDNVLALVIKYDTVDACTKNNTVRFGRIWMMSFYNNQAYIILLLYTIHITIDFK